MLKRRSNSTAIKPYCLSGKESGNMATIYFKCKCAKNLAVDAAGVGRIVKCPDCGVAIQIPQPTLHMTCAKCGGGMNAPENLAGCEVECADCGTRNTIPKAGAEAYSISFNCPRCKQKLEAPQDMAGEIIECPGCKNTIKVPVFKSMAPPPFKNTGTYSNEEAGQATLPSSIMASPTDKKTEQIGGGDKYSFNELKATYNELSGRALSFLPLLGCIFVPVFWGIMTVPAWLLLIQLEFSTEVFVSLVLYFLIPLLLLPTVIICGLIARVKTTCTALAREILGTCIGSGIASTALLISIFVTFLYGSPSQAYLSVTIGFVALIVAPIIFITHSALLFLKLGSRLKNITKTILIVAYLITPVVAAGILMSTIRHWNIVDEYDVIDTSHGLAGFVPNRLQDGHRSISGMGKTISPIHQIVSDYAFDRFDHINYCDWTNNIEMLVSEGHKINATDGRGNTPLSWAVFLGTVHNNERVIPMTQYLLSKGANVNLGAPLVAAFEGAARSKFSDVAVLEKLVDNLFKKGADINQKNNHGNTLLHLAAQYHYAPYVEYALKRGADANAQDIDGNTALHLMTRLPWDKDDEQQIWQYFLVRVLVKYGVNPLIQNNLGETGLTAVKRAEWKRCVAELESIVR